MKLVITSGDHPVFQDTGGGGCGGGGGAAAPRDGGHDLKHPHTLQECVTYGRIVQFAAPIRFFFHDIVNG